MARLLLLAKEIWTFSLLLVEAITIALWPLCVWVLFFFGAWLFGVAALGVWVSYSLSLLFFTGLVYFLFKARLRLPRLRDVKRRLETDSGVKHRPLSKDKPIDDNPLWQKNQAYLKAQIKRLRWVSPRAFLSGRDPYALRMLALLFFISGVFVSGASTEGKILSGMFPFTANETTQEQEAGTRLWVSPPDYTGLAQITVFDKENSMLQIPAYSQIKASTKSYFGVPSLRLIDMSDETVVQEWDFIEDRDYHYTIEAALPEDLSNDGRYSFRIGSRFFTQLNVEFTLVPDNVPSLVSLKPPETLGRHTLKFFLEAQDDYGLQELVLYMQLDPIIESPPALGAPFMEERLIVTPAGETSTLSPVYDLTHHSWAGLPVMFSFEARDARGQTAFSQPIYAQLPERPFRHPIARKLIEYRKKLIWNPLEDHLLISRELELILMRPDLFQLDLLAAMGMRSAASRLRYTPAYTDQQVKTARELVRLLWDTALRIEDGDLSMAARNLKRAKERLQQALQDPNSSEAEKEALMQEMKQALAEYFMEMQKEMQKRANGMEMPEDIPLLSPEDLAKMNSTNAFSEFLKKMEEQIMNGDMQDAQEMLSQLEQMMEMMHPDNIREMPQDMQMMQQGISELQELIDRQQDLLDQTHRQEAQLMQNVEEALKKSQRNGSFKSDFQPLDLSQHTVEQDALRFILGQLMIDVSEKVGNIPPQMGKAEMEMRESSDKLGQNMPGPAVPHQERAIEYLKDSQEQMSEQLSQRMQQMIMMPMMSSSSSSGEPMYEPGQYDPLGREHHENPDEVEIPDEMNRRRVQEIQKILRDRSGDRARPQAEREYYRRLLKQF